MAESDSKQSFWTTLPGILTGIAALLTAATGALVVFYPHSAGSKDAAATTGSSAVETARAAPPTGGSSVVPAAGSAPVSAPMAQQKQQATVRVTSKEGEVSRLFLKSFRYSGVEKIDLTSGQTISFEKIRSIDFSPMNDLIDVKVTLVDGRVVEGSLSKGYAFNGETDVGPFNIQADRLKQIAFER